MKIELHIDPSLTEPTVSIYAPSRTTEIDALLDRLTDPAGPLLGFRSDGTAVPLELDAVLRFYGEDKAVHAQTVEGTYLIRSRLYELEQRLDGRRFVRISHSEIINLKRVTALDLSLTGTIRVTLAGSVTTYVSRRYVRKIKEVLRL